MRKALFAVATALIAAALILVPLPFLAISPGLAVPVGPRVALAHPEDEVRGRLLLTTVRLSDLSAIGALVAWIDDERSVVGRRRVVPSGVEREEFIEAQRRLFEESAEVAAAVGLRAAGFDVQVRGAGAQVVTVVQGAPAQDELRTGDVIVAVEGQPVEVAADLVAALSEFRPGDRVTLTIERAGQRGQVEVQLGRLERLNRAGLGVGVATVDLRLDLPFDVDVQRGRIVGPSAGLMLALTVYDLANEEDLTGGRIVAGTGTIDLSGRVGPVGGVRQKIEAAEDAGASVFLVPEEEAAAARDAAGQDLRVVSVATIDDAIRALSS